MARGKYAALPTSEKPELHERRRKVWTRNKLAYAVSLVFLAFASLLAGLLVISWLISWPWPWPHHHEAQLTYAEWRNGTYVPDSRQIAWLPDGLDGEYLERTVDSYVLAQWPERNPRKVCGIREDFHGEHKDVQSVILNKARTHAVVATDVEQHWRHSTFGNFWLFDLSGKGEDKKKSLGRASIAEWSPSGEEVAIVRDSDVYVYDVDGLSTRVTFDGGPGVFNGIPDWVYEEEVFSGDSAMWWSSEGEYLAYLRTNDTLVPEYPLEMFVTGDEYPRITNLKYPKPGYVNPEVELWVWNGTATQAVPIPLAGKLVTECIWIQNQLLFKVMDRTGDEQHVYLYKPDSGKAKNVRSEKATDGGWFEITHNVKAFGDGYIDTLTHNGYNHLALFEPAWNSTPKLLTSGEWEVSDVPYTVHDSEVYFTGTFLSPISQTILRTSLNGSQLVEPLVGEGVYSASWSPDGSFGLITERKPDSPPNQRVINTVENRNFDSASPITTNDRLRYLFGNRTLPTVIYDQIEVNGVSVNVREIRPSGFVSRRKYPLLFFNYGGPGSQLVTKQQSIDYQMVYAETHNAVVVTVDPRGTGFRGREFRSCVRDHLGDYEAEDVIAVAADYNKRSYINPSTTTIWGWSYGGYLTLKTLERDENLEFKYGVAVAPVTNWHLYDSIYTERYMHTPDQNPKGYMTSGIKNVTNIGRHERFFIMHGTGDDNVHVQNTLWLLDDLDLAGVENYDVHVFPDSNHGIYFHNANQIVFDKLDLWLSEQQSKNSKHL